MRTDEFVNLLEARGLKPKRTASGWESRCPSHRDQRASLSIGENGSGRTLLNCHAGCQFTSIVRSLGLSPMALRGGTNGHARPLSAPTYATPEDAAAALSAKMGAPSARWPYYLGDRLVGVVIRWDGQSGKTIRPVSLRPDGSWAIEAMPTPRPLYRLPELSKAPRGSTVFVVEGERCADAAGGLGLIATTSAGGSAAAAKSDWTPLAGRDAVILPDNDGPGEAYANAVAARLLELGCRVRIVRLPGLPDGGDIVDFIELRDSHTSDEIREEITAMVDSAEPVAAAELPPTEAPSERPALEIRSAREQIAAFPRLREPLVDGLLRRGESANIIAAAKVGKSWLALQLLMCIAAGRPFLGHATRRGRVLLVDDELHNETIAHRLPKVADALGINIDEYADTLDVASLRGRLKNLDQLCTELFDTDYSLIVLDAWYRALPPDISENDNAGVAKLYNTIDELALARNTSWINIHHASKGRQDVKSVVDVGAGAGSQARAADCHIVLRPHAEPDTVVLEAALRSWPALKPVALRWRWPIFEIAIGVDPTQLRTAKTPATGEWTAQRLVDECFGEPRTRAQAHALAVGLPIRRFKELVTAALELEILHRLPRGNRNEVEYLSKDPPSTPEGDADE